ncbi:uncharacterized protein LOC105828147 [Monomorium pharaonis]|uniref:uncharacterized protein LOC105828147 n=1 Tax=Monomorium pharaonis TaxID=307658 RepID=UPI00063F75FB|nr:uncharacterized protein LOC105828147 [Monomorium pharaonis]XP_028047644.1 uncharacterized protein LOC105828147 [Monomorium pharaonis]XP_036139118.1 uncharacterized protein LOC105828147 [Monomorium pharaonis]
MQSELTELELRIIGIIGAEYVEGSKHCADSIPEEESLLDQLEQGNSKVLLATPQVISVCTNVSSENSQDANSSYNNDRDLILNDDCSLNDVEHNAVIEIEDCDATPYLAQNKESKKTPKVTTTISSSKTNKVQHSLSSKQAEQTSSSSENIYTSTSSRKFNRVTPYSKQINSLTEYFHSIA